MQQRMFYSQRRMIVPKFIITIVIETDQEKLDDADEMVDIILGEGLDIYDKTAKLIKASVVEKEN